MKEKNLHRVTIYFYFIAFLLFLANSIKNDHFLSLLLAAFSLGLYFWEVKRFDKLLHSGVYE